MPKHDHHLTESGRCRIHTFRKSGFSQAAAPRTWGKTPNRKGTAQAGRGHIPGRVDITGWPAVVGHREHVGDREADTSIGKGRRGAVVSPVDRGRRFTPLQRVERKTAGAVGARPRRC